MEVSAGTADAAVIDLLMAGAMIGEGTNYANLTYTVNLNTAQGLESEEYGVGFLMEPKEMTSPRGTAPTSVTKKSWRVLIKPVFKAVTTVRNSVELKKESMESLERRRVRAVYRRGGGLCHQLRVLFLGDLPGRHPGCPRRAAGGRAGAGHDEAADFL